MAIKGGSKELGRIVKMATVLDVARYIMDQLTGTITAMKLQKLVYYCQAWSLVWDDKPLFEEKIEAWANGPVIPELYDRHRGAYEVFPRMFPGNPNNLDENQKETIDIVLKDYGKNSSYELSQMTHVEDPWRNQRFGLGPGDRGYREISKESIAEYYSSLLS